MRALEFVYIEEEVAHAHAQNAPPEWFSSTPLDRSCAEAVEQDQLVVYQMIYICVKY